MIAKRITLDDIPRPDANVRSKNQNDLRARIQHLSRVFNSKISVVVRFIIRRDSCALSRSYAKFHPLWAFRLVALLFDHKYRCTLSVLFASHVRRVKIRLSLWTGRALLSNHSQTVRINTVVKKSSAGLGNLALNGRYVRWISKQN